MAGPDQSLKYFRVQLFCFLTVLGIRIRRIRIFLGLPDPDPLVRGMDADGSSSAHKGVERTEIMLAKLNFIFKTKF
jgi:hypothetical protein